MPEILRLVEIGRPGSDAGAPWTAWTAPLLEGGVLYRTLIVADDALIVTVDIQRCRGAETRTLHRGRHNLLQATDHGLLTHFLGSANEATRAALVRSNQGCSTRPASAVVSAAAAGRRFGPPPRGP
jgi:hypothetical protein